MMQLGSQSPCSLHQGIPGRLSQGARPTRVIPRAGKPNAGEPSYVPLEKEALIRHIAAGMKPRDKWRIGTEHEKFGFQQGTFERITYPQIEKVLQSLISRFGWQPMEEEGRIIGVTLDGQSVTLEPGGQFELSGAPVHTIQQTCAEVNNHLYQVKTISQELGIGFLGTGFDPKWSIKDIPLMPKDRYNLMTAYMPKVGSMGLDMMRRTCTVQVNLDYESEQDMIEKFRVGLALQPMANALFASSPFKDGKPTGCLSTRGFTWTDVDNARSGGLPFVFDPDMSFERYVDYAMDVPMYFVYRNGKYVDALGQSWRDFMAGKLPALPGQYPTVSDWENHLTTIFPEVRLKRYLEMRGADGGPWRMLCALPALWVGLLYEPQAQSEALAYIQDWTNEEREYLRVTAPRLGLRTPFRGGTVQDQAKVALAIAKGGLQRRGLNEESFLERLEVIADTGLSQADHMLAMYETKWQRSVDPIYEEYAY